MDERLRAIRLSAVSVVWLGGLAAGFFGFLAAAAKYGCAAGDHAFGCSTSGSVVGILIVVAVILIVVAVTVMTRDRPLRRILVGSVVGFVALAVCFAAAQALLATV